MKKRSWTVTQLKNAIKDSFSMRQVIKKVGLIPTGGNYKQIKKYIEENNFSTSHFKGRAWNKGMSGIGKPKLSLAEILIRSSDFQSYKLKKRLFKAKLKPEECELCGWKKMTIDGRLPLELDHMNGNPSDNRLENLRILCPNCHSLQPTHRGKNRKN